MRVFKRIQKLKLLDKMVQGFCAKSFEAALPILFIFQHPASCEVPYDACCTDPTEKDLVFLVFLAYVSLCSPCPHPKCFAHGMQASCIP